MDAGSIKPEGMGLGKQLGAGGKEESIRGVRRRGSILLKIEDWGLGVGLRKEIKLSFEYMEIPSLPDSR